MGKVENPVLLPALSGGDRVPDWRRQERHGGFDLPADARLGDLRQVREPPRSNQWSSQSLGGPIDSDQQVYVDGDIVFQVDNAATTSTGFGKRTRSARFATIGKALGDLSFESANGNFVMGAGEKLSVAGTATINTPNGDARLSDVAALDLRLVWKRPGGDDDRIRRGLFERLFGNPVA